MHCTLWVFCFSILKVSHGLAHLREWGRQAGLARCHQTHCMEVCQLFRERERRKQVFGCSFVLHSVGETSITLSTSLSCSKWGEAFFFITSELYMWILNSDATQVDKLAVQWQCNQKTSLLNPDIWEIVECLWWNQSGCQCHLNFQSSVNWISTRIEDNASLFLFCLSSVTCFGSGGFVWPAFVC